MIKRLVWLVLGMATGIALVLKGQAEARRRAAALRPDALAATAARSVRHLGVDLRKAAEEGRSAAALREAELRDRLDARTRP